MIIGYYDSPLGTIVMSSDGDGLTGLWFEGQKYAASAGDLKDAEERSLPVFEETARWLDIYFAGRQPDFCPKLKPSGTEFKIMVCDIMKQIPYGETTTYGDIAREVAMRMGKDRMSAQAVGGAVGHNPIGIIIPCHRVIGSDGSLTGYAGGMHRKEYLLTLEKVIG